MCVYHIHIFWYAYILMCVQVHIRMCICTCGSQNPDSGVTLQVASASSNRVVSSLTWNSPGKRGHLTTEYPENTFPALGL